MSVKSLADSLCSLDRFSHHIAHIQDIPARLPAYSSPDPDLPGCIRGYLDSHGYTLYTHQCECLFAIRNGEHVILTTPTASGKTLAFTIPVFERFYNDPEACALFLYPTKALTNDQLASLHECEAGTGIRTHGRVYDGDTPRDKRPKIRETARIVLTNPHELHHVLAWHHQWARLLSNLHFIVIDEAHRYRGVSGSHMAFLVRRLRRLCRHYGSDPRFVLSTATLANPGEFAEKLCGVPFRVISKDGSPAGKRRFVLYNPFPDGYPENSVYREATDLIVHSLRHDLQTLCFTGSRKITELLTSWVKGDRCRDLPGSPDEIAAYRAGYLPGERREIERRLKNGDLRGVVSTNALEVGIDVGSLDCVIMTGFPGTMMSTWQQTGRAGRKNAESIAILVGFANPLDQYFMRHPDTFFSAHHEHAIIDLENPYIYAGHVLCAAAELPVVPEDNELFPGPMLPAVIESYAAQKILSRSKKGWVYTSSRRPADRVSLGSISGDSFRVVCDGTTLETLDKSQAYREAHQGAILLHQGEQYHVDRMDLERHVIQVSPVDVDYYTRPMQSVDISVTRTVTTRVEDKMTLCSGEVTVSETYTSYRVMQHDTILSVEALDLPPITFNTRALWFDIPSRLEDQVRAAGEDIAGGMHGVEHAFIAMMPFHVLCDRRDIGGLSTPFHESTGGPAIFIYDGYEGGIGLSEKAFDIFPDISKTAYELVRDCTCEKGCPACIYSPKCGSDNQPLDKAATVRILEAMRDGKN